MKMLNFGIFDPPPFRGVRANTWSLLMAHWKACMQLSVSGNWTFFLLSATAQPLWSQTYVKCACLKGGRSLFSRILRTRNKIQALLVPLNSKLTPLLRGRKLEGLPFRMVYNIAGRFFGLVTKHACDRQTDRQTDRRTDRITTPKTALA